MGKHITNKLNYKLVNLLMLTVIIISVYGFLKYAKILDLMMNTIYSLTPFFIAFFISWLMYPVGRFLHEKWKINRRLSMAIAVFLNLLFLLLVVGVLLPLAILQLLDLLNNSKAIWNSFSDTINQLTQNNVVSNTFVTNIYNQINEYLSIKFNIDTQHAFTFETIIQTIISNYRYITSGFVTVFSSVTSVVSAILQMGVAYILSFYFIGDVNGFSKKILKLFSGENHQKNITIVTEISKTILGYVRGLILDCTCLFTLEVIGLSTIGMTSPVLLAAVAAIFNVVPYVGPVIGAVPILIIALSISLKTFILAVIVFFGAQFIEAYFILPRIMSKVTNLHPVSVIVGLIIFYQFFGFLGMIIATPAMASINIILKHSKYDIHL